MDWLASPPSTIHDQLLQGGDDDSTKFSLSPFRWILRTTSIGPSSIFHRFPNNSWKQKSGMLWEFLPHGRPPPPIIWSKFFWGLYSKNGYENEDLSPLRPPWKNAVFSSLKPLFQAGKAVLSNIFWLNNISIGPVLTNSSFFLHWLPVLYLFLTGLPFCEEHWLFPNCCCCCVLIDCSRIKDIAPHCWWNWKQLGSICYLGKVWS